MARNGRKRDEELALGCWVMFRDHRGPSMAPTAMCVVEQEEDKWWMPGGCVREEKKKRRRESRGYGSSMLENRHLLLFPFSSFFV